MIAPPRCEQAAARPPKRGAIVTLDANRFA